jgi:hypothetical protein
MYSVTHFTTLFGAAGRFDVYPLYKTKASDSDGMSIITLSSTADDVDWEMLNFSESEL